MYGIEKEMIEDYGVESSVWIGGKRIVLGINEENTEKPRYMSCIVTDNGLFGRYEGITTDDYFEALKHFGENIRAESIILRDTSATTQGSVLTLPYCCCLYEIRQILHCKS